MQLNTRLVVLVSNIYLLLGIIVAEHIEEKPFSCPKSSLLLHPCNCTRSTVVGLSIECDNVNLASLSIPITIIAENKTIVEKLSINHGQFDTIFGTIFHKLKAHQLFIRNTPIDQIDNYVFYGINETLTHLEFENANFDAFPKSVYILGKLVSLVINKHRINLLNRDTSQHGLFGQHLERLSITNGNISELDVEFSQIYRKLKFLDLHGNSLGELKKKQFKHLRDLESLDISHNRLNMLDASHIAELTKLGVFNASHNNISEIARGTFARNSVLRLLDMSHNRIKRLDANSFRGMRFLRRLYLNDNSISDVGRGTFSSVTRIGTIDLARNHLKQIDFQMFSKLINMEHINLAENQITEVQKQSFIDLYLVHINISHNMIQHFERLSFENCVNMTLDLSHNQIETFPKNTFDENSYAANLLLSYNQLKNMSAVPIANMTGIRLLNISHNNIQEIPKNTFPKLYELHTIDASHNEIQHIFNGVFQTLFSLRYLNMSENHLKELNTTTLGTLPTLLELDLNNNQLRKIGRGALTKLSSLRSVTIENNELTSLFEIPISLNVLSLRNNRISEIKPRTWPTMNSLIWLDLSSNIIENHLDKESFTGLQSLRHLNLNQNNISQIPKESLSNLPTLQHLHLESNQISEIPRNGFGVQPVVFEINLRKNQISSISSKAFDGLMQLISLDLSMNNISIIPNDAFYGLVSMQNLDLSFNSLTKLDNKTNGALDYCLTLEKINLSNNRFSFISKKTFPSAPYVRYRLREIDLSHNGLPVLTKEMALGMQNVKILNISHNSINEILNNVLLNLTMLETLDLSYNQLSTFRDTSDFTFPPSLSQLIITNNHLREFPIRTLSNLTETKLLDLQNNRIETFDVELLNRVEYGLRLLVTGNPINCDCNMRPLIHFYDTILEPPKIYTDIVCHSPPGLENRHLYEVKDDHLNCNNVSKHIPQELNVKPDLEFREIVFSNGNLTVWWTVNKPNKDIAGFYMLIRNQHNQILVEHHVSYDRRIDAINGNEICSTECSNLELCILTKNSNGAINEWYDAQCKYLPNNLRNIWERSDKVFVIYSRKKKVDRSMYSANVATNNQKNFHKKYLHPPIFSIVSLCFYFFV